MTSRDARTGLDLRRYHELTRGVTVSFAYLMPLLAVYEVGVWLSGLDMRNAAELSLKGSSARRRSSRCCSGRWRC